MQLQIFKKRSENTFYFHYISEYFRGELKHKQILLYIFTSIVYIWGEKNSLRILCIFVLHWKEELTKAIYACLIYTILILRFRIKRKILKKKFKNINITF